MQRELIALEEEMYRSVIEKGRWRNTITNNPTRSDLVLELHSSHASPPHPRNPIQQSYQQKEHSEDYYQSSYNDIPDPYQSAQQRMSRLRSLKQTPSPSSVLYSHMPRQNSSDTVPGGLDPSMALPRGLPRNAPHPHQTPTQRRESFYSGIGQENDWRQLANLDPDSLAGIQIYGDTTDFQLQPPSQISPATASSPLNKYPIYEFIPAKKSSEWQQERHLQQLQQQAILRQLHNDDDVDEFSAEITARQQRQNSISQDQQQKQQQQQQQQEEQQRQLVSPPLTFVEKEKKTGFASRFSFLTRRRQGQHQRTESMPAFAKESWAQDNHSGYERVESPFAQSGSRGTLGHGEPPRTHGDNTSRAETLASKTKNSSRVKQIFKGVFGLSKKRNTYSPDGPFRDISLPSTHVRAAMSPSPHLLQQDSSIHSQYYSGAHVQRKGLVTPVSRPETAQSLYPNDNGNNINKVKKSTRESLIDPTHIRPYMFQKAEFEEDGYQGYDALNSNGVLVSPFAQTSLTPPPASSVLRHSTMPHRAFSSPTPECEPTLITAAATGNIFNLGSSEHHKARRSSQLMPIPKESIDSGCDSMGHEPFATASNATTLNHNNVPLALQLPNSNSNSTFQNPVPSVYDNDRRSTLTMTMSMYDNGPAIVSLAQVQKVDLEGLRQDHHHSPSLLTPHSHSHHLSMVAVETPFA
ncbi:hypothetical protein BGZ76_003420 [Entomortierella beljakovae]|nr:hypothetical protein BGZ76_003420 [Entomortierella beljakovae]